MCASIWVLETLMRNEGKGARFWASGSGAAEVRTAAAGRRGIIGRLIACEMLSKSIPVGTRKMVNYA